MKIYVALMKNEPLLNGRPCYRMIECVEMEEENTIQWNAQTMKWNNLFYSHAGHTLMLFHLPTMDIAKLAEKREEKEA